ncbi:hypothetical protein C900_02428 [Fulvivirga imtechensis AK7]|uniref:Uncharacterized protein n=1 Tax=Fulvivirga imtechensis AK7 TaxID=1237149 RepID=L8JRX8_9BACT|nr:hypothetical protein [Fulvivirga imtechensis]ELR71620.1 hypothetical protein C900_02428 [Fulvivirga imtechensis AK7]
MRTIQYLPHTADIRMRLRAPAKQELFKAGLEGMGFILKKSV